MDLADDIRAQKEICAAKQSEWDDNLTPSNPKENTDEVGYFYLYYIYTFTYLFFCQCSLKLDPWQRYTPPPIFIYISYT